LYLYDNHIEKIENLESATQLEQLYLNNNQIKEMGVLNLESLTRLHLEDNEITFVVGLDSCEKLSELYLSNQKLPSYMVLEFDNFSMRAIAKSLEVLDISGNRVTMLSQFMMLQSLRIFLCENNRVDDITEAEIILSVPTLVEASFIGNPVCSMPKYRDRLIAGCRESLRKLDRLEIPPHQKIAIRGLVKHRQIISASLE
jgi:Leucine-rich repeat (LRR) protein